MKKISLLLLVLVLTFSVISVNQVKAEGVVPIFLPNYEIGQNLEGDLFPVYRAIDGKTPITSTVEKILGIKIDLWERAMGFHSEWSSDHNVELVGVDLKEGVLRIELSDPDNFTQGGSYRVRSKRSQIEKTVKQFESVEEVEFLPETLFQP